MKIALVRGAFLNQYEGQLYYPLSKNNEVVAFCSKKPIHDKFPFKVIKCSSPMDLDFGPFSKFKMPILNRAFVDAHWLIGLEEKMDGFDIAHCADTFYNFTHQCVQAKIQRKVKKVVATIFENIPFNNEGIWGRKKFKTDAINNIDAFIAISERSKAALLLEGADESKITVIGQRIDTEIFKPTKLRKKTKEIVILFSGRLEFYKGVYEVVYSAKRLLSDKTLSGHTLKFIMIGDGSEKEKLTTLIGKLHIEKSIEIKSVPYSKMPQIYGQADIFLAPSRATPTYQEQFSTVLLEAQASGLPIVTTYSGGIPENVEDAALMANPGDHYSISEALKSLIVNEKLRLYYGEKARRHVHKHSVSVGSKQIENLYRSLLQT